MSDDFPFHPELLESWGLAMAALSRADLHWLTDYSTIELIHEERALEVCGIQDRDVVVPTARALLATFPEWPYGTIHLRTEGMDRGWRVRIGQGPTARRLDADDSAPMKATAGAGGVTDTLRAAIRRFQRKDRDGGNDARTLEPSASLASSSAILVKAWAQARTLLRDARLRRPGDFRRLWIDFGAEALRVEGIGERDTVRRVTALLEEAFPDWPQLGIDLSRDGAAEVWTVRIHCRTPRPPGAGVRPGRRSAWGTESSVARMEDVERRRDAQASQAPGRESDARDRARGHRGSPGAPADARAQGPAARRPPTKRMMFLTARVEMATREYRMGNARTAAHFLLEAARAARAASADDRDRPPKALDAPTLPAATCGALRLWWTVACGNGYPKAMVHRLSHLLDFWARHDGAAFGSSATLAYGRVMARLWASRVP